jgi:hypothetical protein
MKKLEIINSAIASLEAELVTVENAISAFDLDYRNQVVEIWKSKLEGLLNEGDVIVNDYSSGIRVTRNQVRTKRDGEQYNYAQEIFSISRSEYGEEKTGFNLNTYSTTVDNNFEFDRLITVGKVAGYIKENREALKTEFPTNKIWSSDTYKEKNRVENEIRSLKNEISEIEREAALAKLENEGVEFTAEREYDLPSLDVRFNWTVSRICKIKVVKKTASGKSADLEITTRYKNYEGEVTEQVTTADKVRMEKVEDLVRYNRGKIVLA